VYKLIKLNVLPIVRASNAKVELLAPNILLTCRLTRDISQLVTSMELPMLLLSISANNPNGTLPIHSSLRTCSLDLLHREGERMKLGKMVLILYCISFWIISNIHT